VVLDSGARVFQRFPRHRGNDALANERYVSGLAAMQSEQADCEHLPVNAEAVPAGDLVCYDEVAADARDIELGPGPSGITATSDASLSG
jgi:hypothetical protein